MNGPQTDPSASWGIKQWIAFLHNASSVPPTDPSYALARQDMADAIAHIDQLNQQASAADPEKLRPGALATFAVALGNGASLGILGNVEDTKMYLQAGREAGHGTAAFLGNVAGFGATTALGAAGLAAAAPALSPTAVGALTGGGTGAIQGAAQEPGARGTGALIGAGVGALTGGAGGFVAGRALPFLQRSALLGRFFGASEIDAAEGVLRKELQAQGFSRGDIAKAAAKWRSAQADEAVARSIASRGQATSERLVAKGVPATQAEQRTNAAVEAQLRRYLEGSGRYTAPGDVERMIQGYRETGVIRPMVSTPAAPAGAPAAAQIRKVQAALGRPLAQEERDMLIARANVQPLEGTEGRGFTVTGPRATPVIPASAPTVGEMSGVANIQAAAEARPGHPLWRGTGAPTRSAEVRGGERLTQQATTAPKVSAPSSQAKTSSQAKIAESQAELLRQIAEGGDEETRQLIMRFLAAQQP